MKKDISRSRHFFLVLYCSPVEIDKILLKNAEKIHHCCYICHDKDIYDKDLINDDGEYVHKKGDIEKIHFHMLVSFYNGHTFSSVKRMFTTEHDNPRVEKALDMLGCYRYLTHMDNPDKYQYSSSDIIYAVDKKFYDELLLHGDKKDNDNQALAIVKDLLKGVNPMVMIHRYGRDYVIHKRAYEEVVSDIHAWNASHPEMLNQKVLEDEMVQLGLMDDM